MLFRSMRPAALLVCEGIVDEKTLDFVIGIKADDFRGVEFECEEEGKQTEGISFAVEEVPAYITFKIASLNFTAALIRLSSVCLKGTCTTGSCPC